MIVVRAQIWPHGADPESQHGQHTKAVSGPLGVLGCVIVNNGQGSREHGVYDVYACDADNPNDRNKWLRLGGFENERHSEHRSEITYRGLQMYWEWEAAGCPS